MRVQLSFDGMTEPQLRQTLAQIAHENKIHGRGEVQCTIGLEGTMFYKLHMEHLTPQQVLEVLEVPKRT